MSTITTSPVVGGPPHVQFNHAPGGGVVSVTVRVGATARGGAVEFRDARDAREWKEACAKAEEALAAQGDRVAFLHAATASHAPAAGE